ncbi:hypothetical protein [Catenuloplanes indicus]|uniref:Uncharacterized protein n=1 Tax=Catenuloplanes indicus TaxID=137267 RepID=A0AAE4AVB5_9ACTN|nr:hypothetical protein [Catenuloplanes indicus]MDQ0363556.1 hypothetical protein [Catenuloplanes indicus]
MSVIHMERLRDLARMHDPGGLLSVYVTADPHAATTVPAPWQVRLPHLLTGLRRQLGSIGTGDQSRLRLDDVAPMLTDLLDGGVPGRGRALFAALSTGTVRVVRVQADLGDTVRIGTTAFLRPLAAVHSAQTPAGIVAVGTDRRRATRSGGPEPARIPAGQRSGLRGGGGAPIGPNGPVPPASTAVCWI